MPQDIRGYTDIFTVYITPEWAWFPGDRPARCPCSLNDAATGQQLLT